MMRRRYYGNQTNIKGHYLIKPVDMSELGEVDVVEEFNKAPYQNKTWIYSVPDTLEEIPLPFSYCTGYYVYEEINGRVNIRYYPQVVNIGKYEPNIAYTEVSVVDTFNYPDEGELYLYTTGLKSTFKYTSKTKTSFIGEPQVINTKTLNISGVCNVKIYFTSGSTKRFVICCGGNSFTTNFIGNGNSISVFSTIPFNGTYGLNKGKAVILSDDITVIPRVFYWVGFTGILDIPNQITSIAAGTFRGNYFEKPIILSEGLLNIGDLCFYQTKVDEFIIRCSPTIIGYGIFGEYPAKSITIEKSTTFRIKDEKLLVFTHEDVNMAVKCLDSYEGVLDLSEFTSLDYYCFIGCSGITSVANIPETTVINDYCFAECTGITEIIIPETIQTISNYAFSECTGLEIVRMSNNVTSLLVGAFKNCHSDVYFNGTLEEWFNITVKDRFAVPFNEGGNLYCNDELVTSVVLNKDPKFNLTGCKSITSVEIFDTDISGYAFFNCTEITDLNLHGNISKIGDNAFTNHRLSTIDLSAITSNLIIGNFAFSSGNGNIIKLSSSTIQLGTGAFGSNLYVTDIYVPCDIPPTMIPASSGVYTTFRTDILGSCIVHVPIGLEEIYRNTEGWNLFTNIIGDL